MTAALDPVRGAAVHVCDTALRLAVDVDQARSWATEVLSALGVIGPPELMACGHPRSRLRTICRITRCIDCINARARERYAAGREAAPVTSEV